MILNFTYDKDTFSIILRGILILEKCHKICLGHRGIPTDKTHQNYYYYFVTSVCLYKWNFLGEILCHLLIVHFSICTHKSGSKCAQYSADNTTM